MFLVLECDAAYGMGYSSGQHICASDLGKGVCPGDYGGPMTCAPDNKLCGIISWGYSCAIPEFPMVSTRVTSFVDWIKSHL